MSEIPYNLRSRKISKPQWKSRQIGEEISGEKLPEQHVTTTTAPDSPRRFQFEEPMTEEEMLAWNRKMWMIWAEKALSYYNLKQGANFKLLEVRGVMLTTDMPSMYVHMNFKAESDSASSWFFTELMVPWGVDEQFNVTVNGCCALKMVDSGNPKARDCVMCRGSCVLHPGPYFGYCCESGDNFASEEWNNYV